MHAALSVAGVAAALVAKNSKHDESTTTARESIGASATALEAAQCAQVAEAMGAKRE